MLNLSCKKYLGILVFVFLIFASSGVFNRVKAAASLYFTASSVKVYVGQNFTLYPKVNTGGDATNAYIVNITFSSNSIQPVSITKNGSICSLYTSEPSYTSTTATISCGLPTPGYNGSAGGLGVITFKAKGVGSAVISISGASKVLANDGLGTDILGSTGSITITITEPPPPPVAAPTVTASVGADGLWVSTTEITFSWNVPSGAKGFSYIFTQDPNAAVPKTNMGNGTSISYSDLADGIYYFKIIATDGSQWSTVTTYTLKIDTTPPHDIQITTEPSSDNIIEVLPQVIFSATDDLSGIDHYEIKIDDGEYIIAVNPYQIESITSGEHTITIKAVDVAGNSSESSINIKIAEVQAPVLIKPENNSYIPIGEKLVIEGTTTPNSQVFIYLNGELIAEVTSNESGYFSFTYDKLLLEGKYELYATSKDDGGILSRKSEIIKFKVDPYAVRIGGYVIPSFCLGLFILLLLILLLLLLIIIYRKWKKYREKVKEKLSKAKDKIDDEFEELERDVRNEVEETLSQEKKQQVSKRIEHELERDLTDEVLEAKSGVEEALNIATSDKTQKGNAKNDKQRTEGSIDKDVDIREESSEDKKKGIKTSEFTVYKDDEKE
jgi:hypothetical protein